MEVLHQRCCGLDVHKENVVACLRIVSGGEVVRKVRTFESTTVSLMALSKWLAENGCTHVAMEATGVYWKPVWHILDDGDFQLILANASHVKNVPGRKTDVNDATWLADLWRLFAVALPNTIASCCAFISIRSMLLMHPLPPSTSKSRQASHLFGPQSAKS
jgi:hypothetical protein